jgi:dimethylargininase
MQFTTAIVRPPAPSFVNGLTTSALGKPDHAKALDQHAAYVEALRACGLMVTVLDPDDRHPDSTFVEDTALVASDFAILTRPGAPSRRGEVEGIESALRKHFSNIERVVSPGTVDAGDIMMVGSHFYVGLSSRTNLDGANQILRILSSHGRTGSTVPLSDALHLKSAVSYIEFNNLVATERMAAESQFADMYKLVVPTEESYAANCLWINGTVLVASGHPTIKSRIQSFEYSVIELDMSEFQKLDGGLSCLSLRF